MSPQDGDRRAAFRAMASSFNDLAEKVPDPPFPRPPGAEPEGRFLALCTGCTDCVDACPHKSIGRYPTGHRLAGTPAMDPNRTACHLCADVPCAAACTTGALLPLGPEVIFFGLAHIVEERCIPFKGPECGACKPACPPKAITMQLTRPIINADLCNGCGLCREACPVWDPAIEIDL